MEAPKNVDPIADLSTAMNTLNVLSNDIGEGLGNQIDIRERIGRVVDFLHPTYLLLQANEQPKPIPMLLWCPSPECGARHIDLGRFEAHPHHTHSCQQCGMTWRPAVVPTVGVRFLPGFKDTDNG